MYHFSRLREKHYGHTKGMMYMNEKCIFYLIICVVN